MESSKDSSTERIVSVIGRCVVVSCQRPAATHLVLQAGGHRLVGTVCEHCELATRGAAFLMELAV